jgi:hypothetical protein
MLHLQTIFNFSVVIYFILSSAHLIWQVTSLPKEIKELRNQIIIALLINLILLSLGIFLIS